MNSHAPPAELMLDAVIIAVSGEAARVLTVPGVNTQASALPSGPLDLDQHATLERGMRDWVQRQAALSLGYVEQLYTYGDRFRDPRERAGGPRVISAAYLALVQEADLPAEAPGRFTGIYEHLPWEDWRKGRPEILDGQIRNQLSEWAGEDVRRRERVALTFGLDGAPWDSERTLERYELLWEAGLLVESVNQAKMYAGGGVLGKSLALDHRRILATALGRLRGKIRYRPVVFELLPKQFTLLQLQRVVEALAGNRVHKQNFRRLVEGAGLVEGTGKFDHASRGRPAEWFRFRREVFRERPAPGVYFPGAWWSQ